VTVRPIELGRHGSDLPLDIGYSTLKLAPKPSEGLLHGAYRHVLIESALIVLAFYRLCGDPTAAFLFKYAYPGKDRIDWTAGATPAESCVWDTADIN
jgi:hypothetical protein